MPPELRHRKIPNGVHTGGSRDPVQQAKAIALLRKHLVDNVKTSALVYLDLLDLYHQAGNVQDYEDLRDDVNKVPVLGDLPALGNLFKTRSRVSNKSEMLIFITPRVLGRSAIN